MQEKTTSGSKLSALVISYNEIGYIQKCIASISFADEIIVVDSYSTDGTYEFLMQQSNVRVIQKPFSDFTTQKSFALSQASNDWVLFIDADEVITPSLEKEIKETICKPNAAEAYWFYRKFMFQRERLNFSGWQTDKNHRLFRKSKVKFTHTKLVHETLEVAGNSGELKEKLEHYCYKNFGDYKAKMLHYGMLRAKEEFSQGKAFSYAKLFIKPLWRFLYNYVIRLGFLDLHKGIIICYLNSLSVYTRYAELKRLENLYKKPTFVPTMREGKLVEQL